MSQFAQSQIMFERHYGGSDDDGGFITSGFTRSFDSDIDAYLIKTDAERIYSLDMVYQTVSNIKVLPNLSDGNIHIEFDKEQLHNLFFHLYDIKGKLIYSQSEKFSNETYFHLSLPFLSNGIYFLQISGEKHSQL